MLSATLIASDVLYVHSSLAVTTLYCFLAVTHAPPPPTTVAITATTWSWAGLISAMVIMVAFMLTPYAVEHRDLVSATWVE